MNMQTFPSTSQGSQGGAKCMLKVAGAFAALAVLVVGCGWVIENWATIESAKRQSSALIAGLGIGFWSAGLLAMGMMAIATVCSCALFGSIGKGGISRTMFLILSYGMALGSFGWGVGWVLLDHSFFSSSTLTGTQTAMYFVVSSNFPLAFLVAYMSIVVLSIEQSATEAVFAPVRGWSQKKDRL